MTLDEEGHVQCSYLGTDPSMFTTPTVEVRDIDYAQCDREMAQLQRSIKEQQGKASKWNSLFYLHILQISKLFFIYIIYTCI